jgi:hypothetical protein
VTLLPQGLTADLLMVASNLPAIFRCSKIAIKIAIKEQANVLSWETAKLLAVDSGLARPSHV